MAAIEALKARSEIIVWISVLGPALLYLALRRRDNIRPYGAAWFLLFESETWIRFGRALITQNGVWPILALLGAVLLYKRGRWQVLVACLSVFVVTAVFFLCDRKEAAGYARFDLLLLPPLIVLGWEGLLYCGRKNLLAGIGHLRPAHWGESIAEPGGSERRPRRLERDYGTLVSL